MTNLSRDRSWWWPAIGSLVLLVFVFALSEELKLGIITANLAAASFLALVGMGQMFPIASGEGGIDLSIPFVMNFCAFLAVKIISFDPVSLPLVLLAAIAFGAIVGVVNGLVVVQFRVPPIIGTLAVGFVVLTLVQIVSLGGSTTIANRAVTNFVRSSFLGIPMPAYVVLLIGSAMWMLVNRTAFGRELLALGQNRRAAYLSGIPVYRTIVLAYVISGVMASLAGVLLASSVGSADLELGNPFLLTSVGAVVLGGNWIAGGTASVVGTVLGAVLLTLLVVAVTVAGLPIEAKHIASGLVITIVLVAANAPARTGRRPNPLGVLTRYWIGNVRRG
jgi:ribose transport system permease protein